MAQPAVLRDPDPPPAVHHPRTRYVTTRDGVRLAAQRFGSGPELVVLTGGFSHVEMRWEQPRLARSWRRLSTFSTVTTYDPRGFGLSDREFELIGRELTPGSRRFLVRQGMQGVVCELNLRGFEYELAVISGRTENVQRMERLAAECGVDPALWLPRFRDEVEAKK